MLKTYFFSDHNTTPAIFGTPFYIVILASDIFGACEKLARIAPTAPPLLRVGSFIGESLLLDPGDTWIFDRPDDTLTAHEVLK